jgi:hypothetical protein
MASLESDTAMVIHKFVQGTHIHSSYMTAQDQGA